MKIQLYYFDDCPSYQKALDNLKEALRSQELPQEVEMIPVASEDDAQAKRFIGSPTIRINGMLKPNDNVPLSAQQKCPLV